VKETLRETEKKKGEGIKKETGWWDEECRAKKEVRRELRR